MRNFPEKFSEVFLKNSDKAGLGVGWLEFAADYKLLCRGTNIKYILLLKYYWEIISKRSMP